MDQTKEPMMKQTHLFSKRELLTTFSIFVLLAVVIVYIGSYEGPASYVVGVHAAPQASPTPFPCQPQPSVCPNMPVVTVNSPQVPCDVCIPNGAPGVPFAFFDDYSWRAFIALVWPAQTQNNQRGTPDTTQTVGGTGPRVF